ncbi:hypothetical protein GN244_ATG16526 [Phytophthora infestans]|nr:hypothetical protein GN244_ATG16526 [Phytophthora infestans]
MHYGDSELRKLCREQESQQLSRMLVAAYIYKAEIQMLVAAENDPSVTPTEHLQQLFEVLEGNPAIHAAIHSQDATGCWALLETTLAISAMPSGPAAMEPQRRD